MLKKTQLIHLLSLQILVTSTKCFRIDVTFEMRTVIYGIHLLIDTHQIVRQHFISNGNGGEESKKEERQRECVCVREAAHGGEERIALVIK